ncbi:hypothetical protein GGTG_10008 [Gaeumannomyces tritici R3-111a-1]|uniref:Uncharacterized protein n=1 Tax=Gaeumannomyces tritici (strain R3-111a-1) TaxID=644352 RepID=J3P924_GAET3|nr:hypothetical protein GGTG_10008 [Gaeumannomyces tritici R3-111a-1]EJT73159.1 hypothetical protein GGTG_10008 [Gaeumannomyces tritici R3-111a-1]
MRHLSALEPAKAQQKLKARMPQRRVQYGVRTRMCVSKTTSEGVDEVEDDDMAYHGVCGDDGENEEMTSIGSSEDEDEYGF